MFAVVPIVLFNLGFRRLHFYLQPHPGSTFFQHIRSDLVDNIRCGHDLAYEIVGHIPAVLADAGQNFLEHPMFKLFGTRQLAVDNEPVQVAFRNVGKCLGASGCKGVAFHDTLTMSLQGRAGIRIAQSSCRIAGTEQIFSIFIQNPHLSKFRIVKYLQIPVLFVAYFASFQFGTIRWPDHREMACFQLESKRAVRLPNHVRKLEPLYV